MSNYIKSEPYEYTKGKFEEILEKVVDRKEGYLVIRNSASDYMVICEGVFSMKYHGITKQVFKSNETIKAIFRKRLDRYLYFEHDGNAYWMGRGKWHRMKREFNFD